METTLNISLREFVSYVRDCSAAADTGVNGIVMRNEKVKQNLSCRVHQACIVARKRHSSSKNHIIDDSFTLAFIRDVFLELGVQDYIENTLPDWKRRRMSIEDVKKISQSLSKQFQDLLDNSIENLLCNDTLQIEGNLLSLFAMEPFELERLARILKQKIRNLIKLDSSSSSDHCLSIFKQFCCPERFAITERSFESMAKSLLFSNQIAKVSRSEIRYKLFRYMDVSGLRQVDYNDFERFVFSNKKDESNCHSIWTLHPLISIDIIVDIVRVSESFDTIDKSKLINDGYIRALGKDVGVWIKKAKREDYSNEAMFRRAAITDIFWQWSKTKSDKELLVEGFELVSIVKSKHEVNDKSNSLIFLKSSKSPPRIWIRRNSDQGKCLSSLSFGYLTRKARHFNDHLGGPPCQGYFIRSDSNSCNAFRQSFYSSDKVPIMFTCFVNTGDSSRLRKLQVEFSRLSASHDTRLALKRRLAFQQSLLMIRKSFVELIVDHVYSEYGFESYPWLPDLECLLLVEANEGQVDVSEGQFDVSDGQFDVSDGQVDVNEGQFDVSEAQFETNEAQFETNEAQFETNEAQFETNEAQFETNEGQFKTKQGQFKTKQGQFKTKQGQFKTKQGQFKTKQGQFKTKQGQLKTKQGQFETTKGQFDVNETIGRVLSRIRNLKIDPVNLRSFSKMIMEGKQIERARINSIIDNVLKINPAPLLSLLLDFVKRSSDELKDLCEWQNNHKMSRCSRKFFVSLIRNVVMQNNLEYGIDNVQQLAGFFCTLTHIKSGYKYDSHGSIDFVDLDEFSLIVSRIIQCQLKRSELLQAIPAESEKVLQFLVYVSQISKDASSFMQVLAKGRTSPGVKSISRKLAIKTISQKTKVSRKSIRSILNERGLFPDETLSIDHCEIAKDVLVKHCCQEPKALTCNESSQITENKEKASVEDLHVKSIFPTNLSTDNRLAKAPAIGSEHDWRCIRDAFKSNLCLLQIKRKLEKCKEIQEREFVELLRRSNVLISSHRLAILIDQARLSDQDLDCLQILRSIWPSSSSLKESDLTSELLDKAVQVAIKFVQSGVSLDRFLNDVFLFSVAERKSSSKTLSEKDFKPDHLASAIYRILSSSPTSRNAIELDKLEAIVRDESNCSSTDKFWTATKQFFDAKVHEREVLMKALSVKKNESWQIQKNGECQVWGNGNFQGPENKSNLHEESLDDPLKHFKAVDIHGNGQINQRQFAIALSKTVPMYQQKERDLIWTLVRDRDSGFRYNKASFIAFLSNGCHD